MKGSRKRYGIAEETSQHAASTHHVRMAKKKEEERDDSVRLERI